ncbi:hypothetical protein [Nonomuraea basaltis]|uniref:hypothetical protein n=1 Tax=Nonomuraea basaltis TaxID=2495887 RepID=UPI00110C4950|nr:hypothetical protein [Nonomuraea basaltis]TMR95109.1 hypothetical protein EJK15_30335 [Nonomuraea basaltis]
MNDNASALSSSVSSSPSQSRFPSMGSTPVTARAMRAAADLIETAGVSGICITCDDQAIGIQVSRHLMADLPARLATLSALATVLDSPVLRHDDPFRPASWLRIHGTAAGVPVRVYAELEISIQGEGEALALGPDGHPAAHGPNERPTPLPPGWHWMTELDQPTTQDPAPEFAHGPDQETGQEAERP